MEAFSLLIVLGLQWSDALNVTIGLMSPFADYGMNGPSMSMALDTFTRDHQSQLSRLNQTLNFRLVWRGFNWCHDVAGGTDALLSLIEEEGVDVILGNFCSTVCIPAGYVARSKNLAWFPTGCNDPDLSNKTTFNFLPRMMSPYTYLASSLRSVLQYYGWWRVIMLINDFQMCGYGGPEIQKVLAETNITIAENILVQHQKDLGSIGDDVILSFLEKIHERGRVAIICHDEKIIQRIMWMAEDLGYTSPDYVYIFFSVYPSNFTIQPWLPWNRPERPQSWKDYSQETIEEYTARKSAFKSLRIITVADIPLEDVIQFQAIFRSYAEKEPWNKGYKHTGELTDVFPRFLHDATYLYLKTLVDILERGDNHRDGRLIFETTKGKNFTGVTGNVIMDENGDRSPNYLFYRYDDEDEKFNPFLKIDLRSEDDVVQVVADPKWGTEDGDAPLAVPKCGFLNENCPPEPLSVAALVAGCMVSVCFILFFTSLAYFIRQKRMERELLQMLWKVKYSDLDFTKRAHNMLSSLNASTFRSAAGSHDVLTAREKDSALSVQSAIEEQIYIQTALYKGNLVAVKQTQKSSVTLHREDLLELQCMREMSHENVNTFVGACTDPPNIFTLTTYCHKGSLLDVLENDDIQLDTMFKKSLIQDLVSGMDYIHSSRVVSHGRLRSNNCLIDSRWSLKINGFGLTAFRPTLAPCNFMWKKLWVAPELLRLGDKCPPQGTQEGDIYSFGIILQEIIFRCPPYFIEDETAGEIVEKVIKGCADNGSLCRPNIGKHTTEGFDIGNMDIMMKCWEEDPHDRPSISAIRKMFRSMNRGRKINILDSMVARLEKYAFNLEEIVAQRTSQLVEEKKKTDYLLYQMLPKTVAENLKAGKGIDAEVYESVTIYFSDIVGFTSICSTASPIQVVQLLNDLYTKCDGVLGKYDVYKVETIGDAYMVASGLPVRNGPQHVVEIANMALHLLKALSNFRVAHMPSVQLKLRIGMHTGACAAGVVGLTMPRYCLFGDTVNMASRMESTGEALKIHMSEQSKQAIQKFTEFSITHRGKTTIKGKGDVDTYWLLGKRSQQ